MNYMNNSIVCETIQVIQIQFQIEHFPVYKGQESHPNVKGQRLMGFLLCTAHRVWHSCYLKMPLMELLACKIEKW